MHSRVFSDVTDIWDNWQQLVEQYEVPRLQETFAAHTTLTVIGGCLLTGIDRVIEYVERSDHLLGIDLGSNYWNLSSHADQDSSRVAPGTHRMVDHLSIAMERTGNRVPIVLDDTGFDFLLDISALIPETVQVEYFLVATEPETFWTELRKARPTRCEHKHRLSTAKLNAKYVEIDQRWIANFGVNCPSDVHAVKMYHYKNILSKMIAITSSSKIRMHVVDINR